VVYGSLTLKLVDQFAEVTQQLNLVSSIAASDRAAFQIQRIILLSDRQAVSNEHLLEVATAQKEFTAELARLARAQDAVAGRVKGLNSRVFWISIFGLVLSLVGLTIGLTAIALGETRKVVYERTLTWCPKNSWCSFVSDFIEPPQQQTKPALKPKAPSNSKTLQPDKR
jgi:hypothetical protein